MASTGILEADQPRDRWEQGRERIQSGEIAHVADGVGVAELAYGRSWVSHT
jgi:hypothetical protein